MNRNSKGYPFTPGTKNTKRLIQPLRLYFSRSKSNLLFGKEFAKPFAVEEVKANLNETFNGEREGVIKNRSDKLNVLSFGSINFTNEGWSHRTFSLKSLDNEFGDDDGLISFSLDYSPK